MKKRDAALSALNAIVKALRPLSSEERTRVVTGAMAVLGTPGAHSTPPSQGMTGGGASAALAVVPPPAPVQTADDLAMRAAAEAQAHRRNQQSEADKAAEEEQKLWLAQMKAQGRR